MRRRLSIAILALFILGIFIGLASAKDNGKSEEKVYRNNKKGEIKSIIKEYIDMENEWSREAVMEATVLGYVSGDEFSKFKPNQPLTKLEAMAILLNSEGFQDDVDDYTLTDEEETLLKNIPDWGKKYIAIALQEGLILPDELQKFNPQQGIKRYEVCNYLIRVAGDTEVVPQTKQAFKDWAEIPGEYQAIVQAVHSKGLMNGDEEGKFCPNQIVNRCEMAVVICNLEENVLHRFESSKVRGLIEAVSTPDSNGDYVITVDTGKTNLAEIDCDEETVVFMEGEEIEPEDIVIGSQVNIIIREDKGVLVKLALDDEENEED